MPNVRKTATGALGLHNNYAQAARGGERCGQKAIWTSTNYSGDDKTVSAGFGGLFSQDKITLSTNSLGETVTRTTSSGLLRQDQYVQTSTLGHDGMLKTCSGPVDGEQTCFVHDVSNKNRSLGF